MADNDLISRSALLQKEQWYKDSFEIDCFPFIDPEDVENALAVDAVEVVRCKDCKHCDPENHHCDHSVGTMIYFPRKPDDFCSYGEKRSVEHD